MIYFTSDWHLNDARLGPASPFFRPFTTVHELNRAIIDHMNRIILPEDTMYHLGDVAVEQQGISLLREIKCLHRFLILGNYDVDFVSELSHHFDSIEVETRLNLKGVNFYLNHYPTNRRPEMFNLTGHIHGLWKVQRNMVNVGVDAWHFRPVSEDEIFYIKNAMENYYDENVFIC